MSSVERPIKNTATMKVCDQTGKEVPYSGVGKTQEGWFRISALKMTYRPVGFKKVKLNESNTFEITRDTEQKDFSSAAALAAYLREVADELSNN